MAAYKQNTVHILWIDYAKAIGIYFVILAHLPSGILGFTLYSFHMPLFFIISGMLYKGGGIRKSFKRLLLPVVIYTSISLLFTLPHEENLAFIPYLVFNHKNTNYFSTPLWFVFVLFLHRILNCLFLRSGISKKSLFGISIAFFALSLLLKKHGIKLEYFDLDTFLFTYIFFQIGNTFQKEILEIINSPLKKWEKIVCVIMIPLWIFFIIKNGTVNIFRLEYGTSTILFFFNLAFGTFLTFKSCLKISRINLNRINEFMLLYSGGTLCILALHLYLVKLYTYTIQPQIAFLGTAANLIIVVIASLIILVLFYPIIKVLRKHCPTLL